jgi:alanyl-tRNA synthetase
MTQRLYYEDPYRTQFSAQVVERLTWNDQPAVVLDRTAFYPTGGGQPADRGTLNSVEVLDVVTREADEAVVHVLAETPMATGDEVTGQLDWARRFDHMQQHTGQHVLTAAFERVLDAATVGFHLGSESSTIDLAVADLDFEDIAPAESLANQIIWEDHPIEVKVVAQEDLPSLPLRNPPTVEGPIRLVAISPLPEESGTPFDLTPCGGTHVARTGELGLLKIIDLEHRGDETRVTFVCGGRALRDYRAKDAMIDQLVRRLTVGYWELDEAVARLQDEAKTLRHELHDARQRLLDTEAAELADSAVAHGAYRAVWRILEGYEPDEIRTLARKVADHPNHVALLAGAGDRTYLCFARSDDLPFDMADLIRQACDELGGGGGGRPQVAQGSTPTTEQGRLEGTLTDLLANLPQET